MERQDDIKLVQVFAGEHWQATMIQNILENNDIQAFLENELMGTIAPWRVFYLWSALSPHHITLGSEINLDWK